MKRQVRNGMWGADVSARQLAAHAALGLLQRSIRMGHRRLAVQRLHEAVSMGLSLDPCVWSYCRDAAAASRDAAVQDLFIRSAQAVHAGCVRHG